MKYYFSKLNDKDRQTYKKIYYGIEKFEKRISLDTTAENLHKIYNMVINDNPKLFYINPFKYSYYKYSTNKIEVEPIYLYNMEKVEDIRLKINSVLKSFKENIKKIESKLERERYIHKILMSNINYKYGYDESDIECHTIVGSFVHKQAVCDGISRAFKYLCDIAKINSTVVVGNSWNEYEEKQPHAWNIVKINGNWYHIDVTWDLNLSQRFKYVRYDYFNLTEEETLRDHRDFKIIEDCTSLKNNFFYENDCIVYDKKYLDNFLLEKIKDIKLKDSSRIIYFKLKFDIEQNELFNYCNRAFAKSLCFSRYTIESNSTQGVYLVRY